MAIHCERSCESATEEEHVSPLTSFQPNDRTQAPPAVDLPDELWLTVLESPCTFPPDIFSDVMINLIKNPNITSSHLFRADIFYDSEQDRTGGLLQHLKVEYRPLAYELPGYTLTRTIVRQMVPRNPQLDRALVQTCHFFTKQDEDREENVVVYLPHIKDASELPFYHPSVARLAFTHTWPPPTSSTSAPHASPGPAISLSYSLFPSTPGHPLPEKLHRTALRLLQTVHKHGQGQLQGYTKRVHHDQIIPQPRYQTTYARLKAKYGRQLSEQWAEVTDPGKHVFEEIGIAAYLVEVWGEMYGGRSGDGDGEARDAFPGFVDIGCGNGVLTYILLAEGYAGRGSDARERKTWKTFPAAVQARLQRQLLVPSPFQSAVPHDGDGDKWHDGLGDPGAFIVSNHADELTAWTPLLAYLNNSSFLAIPCCSHDLSGARFRAPPATRASQAVPARLPQQFAAAAVAEGGEAGRAAETGSLARTVAQKKMASAYSTLCGYVASLAEEVGFEAEKDVLRIPSTRNTCILGRRRRDTMEEDVDARMEKVKQIVVRELGRSVDVAGKEWVERAEGLAQKPGSGH